MIVENIDEIDAIDESGTNLDECNIFDILVIGIYQYVLLLDRSTKISDSA